MANELNPGKENMETLLAVFVFFGWIPAVLLLLAIKSIRGKDQ